MTTIPDMSAIHQITAGFREGDAITNMSREMRRIFRDWGYSSDIYVEPSRIAPKCRHEVLSLNNARNSITPEDILILHLSIGCTANDQFPSLPGRKVICYHNVTPSFYFEGLNPVIAASLSAGRKQAASLKNIPELTFADSDYNASELIEMGYSTVHTLPFIMNIGRITEDCSGSMTTRLKDGFTNILFVGRCVPNKRIEDLIETFFWYHTRINRRSRLIHVGPYDGLEAYHALLLSQVSDLGINEHVWMTGSVSQSELNAFYQEADLFLCLSEHEGFCVPLLEAMLHNIPVMASANAAVPETLDGAGVLIHTGDKPFIAESINMVLSDNSIRTSIISSQEKRIDRYRNRDINAELKSLLAPLLTARQ